MDEDSRDAPRLERSHDGVPENAAPEIKSLFRLWGDQLARSGVPNRSAMDPFALRPWIGHLSIYEALDGGRDFRNRLEGTAIVELTGEDWTGKLASTADQKYGSGLVPAMQETIASQKVAIHTMKVYQNGFKTITRLLLPVRSRADGPIDQIFVAIYVDSVQPIIS